MFPSLIFNIKVCKFFTFWIKYLYPLIKKAEVKYPLITILKGYYSITSKNFVKSNRILAIIRNPGKVG